MSLAFSSRTPPDIQPNSRIIVICGVTDYVGENKELSSSSKDEMPSSSNISRRKTGLRSLISKTAMLFSKSKRMKQKGPVQQQGRASPLEDGCFLSDFFMFYHLFHDLGARQRWIMCKSSRNLLGKYGTYGHGERTKYYCIVLNANLLPGIENDPNIRIFERKDLLQDFLGTFQEKCKVAVSLNQPVVLMIFGHGSPDTYGVAIGGQENPLTAPRLQSKHIIASLHSLDFSLTIFLTSCYSGGWLLQPRLNISALTAAGPYISS